MKKTIRFLTSFFLIYVIFSFAILPVYADTFDGLDVDITTDRTSYSETDSISATITVTNRNDIPVNNLFIEEIIPKGYKIDKKDTTVTSVESIAPGESVKINLKLQSTVKAPVSTKTIILYSIIGVVAAGVLATGIVIIVKICKKTKKNTVAMVLCLAFLGGAVLPSHAQAEQYKRTQLTLAYPIAVEDKDVLLNASLSYDSIKSSNAFLDIDSDGVLYDMITQTYHLTSLMPVLSGILAKPDNVASFNCSVTDVNGNLLSEGPITPANFWSLNHFSLIVGINHIKLAVEYRDGTSYEKTFTVNNVCAENMSTLNVDMDDSDADGVLNFLEVMYHTDPNNSDTDGDGLSDYYEMAVLKLSPILADTDGNGVSDADEDADNDQLTNIQEITTYLTNPICMDTDGDGLSDSQEVNTYKTDPLKKDTDGDGCSDYWEVINGFDPLAFDEGIRQNETENVPDNITVSSDAEVHITQLTNHEFINEKTPGYIGQAPVYIELEEGHTADIVIEYDPAKLGEEDTPALYYYDETTQCYELIESTINNSRSASVSASVSKTGVYVLLNHRLVDDVWKNEIFRPSEDMKDGVIDVVFVIDRSLSMDDNDPGAIRKLVTKEFINKLRDDVDRAAVVQFTVIAETIMPLTYDKEAACNAVDSITNSDGGGCNGSDQNAGTNGSAGIRAALNLLSDSTAEYKYIIFLTDGYDTTVSEDYGDELGTYGLTGEAKSKNIIIHTVGLVGTSEVDIDLLKRVAEGTNGKYFLATVGEKPEESEELFEIYDQIESVTIDRHLDSNNDGISDYYTKLICDGVLTTGTGAAGLFGGATYEQIQENDDFDKDGIINGEELIIIENENGVFVKVKSYPYAADSDKDGMNDLFEYNSGFSSLSKNGYAELSDINLLLNSDGYISDSYLDTYNDSFFTRGSVWVGNAFFGTTLDQTVLYKQMLMEYFLEIDQSLMSSAKIQNYRALASAYLGEEFTQITNEIIEVAESGDEDTFYSRIVDLKDLVSNIQGNLDLLDQTKVYDLIEALINLNPKMQLGNCTVLLNNVTEELKYIPDIIPDGTREFWDNWLSERNAKIFKYKSEKGILENKITLRSDAIKNFSDVVGKIGTVLMVIDVAQTAWDSYTTFADMCASIQTLEKNVYILDCIINTSDNRYLTDAASDLKFLINDGISSQTRELLSKIEQSEGTVSKIVLEYAHTLIAEMGVPGMIIELVRTIGNVVFDLDEVSQGAAETVALAAAADILATNFENHLVAGYAEQYNDYWIAYSDYSHDMYICILNLAELRMMAEAKAASWKNDKNELSTCKTNQETCSQLIDKYNSRYLSFISE